VSIVSLPLTEAIRAAEIVVDALHVDIHGHDGVDALLDAGEPLAVLLRGFSAYLQFFLDAVAA
jgi:hypothetical protein